MTPWNVCGSQNTDSVKILPKRNAIIKKSVKPSGQNDIQTKYLGKSVAVVIPASTEWKTNGMLQGYDAVFSIDRHITVCEVEARVLLNTYSVSESSLPGFVSILNRSTDDTASLSMIGA